jgi:6,7-dimethyl-8-ribityllumazine synthase
MRQNNPFLIFEMAPVKTLKAERSVRGKKFAIIASRFNEFITQRLLDACLKELSKSGVPASHITVAWVPGSFELPVAAKAFAQKKNVHAVICLGCVIRGETYHFELVADNAARGILEASLSTGKPVIFGVLTTDNVEQANKRSEGKSDNKGRDAAQAALEMVRLMGRIKT